MPKKCIDIVKFQKVRQKDPLGCILVNLEIALKYYGESRYDEQELIKHTIGNALSFPNIPRLLNPILENHKIKFKSFRGNLRKLRRYFKKKVNKQIPILLAFNNPDGSAHTKTIICYENSHFHAYDPADGTIRDYSELEFENEIIPGDYHALFLKRKSKNRI